MKSVALLLLTTLLAASAATDAVTEEKEAMPLEPLYPEEWYNGVGEEDERDLRIDGQLRAARVSETEGGLVPKNELHGTEDLQLRAMELRAEDTTVDLRAARLDARLRIDDTAAKNQLGVPLP